MPNRGWLRGIGGIGLPSAVISGQQGAVNPMRLVGATTSGSSPTQGSFLVGDVVVDLKNGRWFICTVAGTPGTWKTPVSSFNGRSGAVTPGNADYLAVASGGLTGAVAATRYVGGTTSGAPSTGTFAVGDFIIDQTGIVWVCTVAGSPGTWVNIVPTPLIGSAASSVLGSGTTTSGSYATLSTTPSTVTITTNTRALVIISADLSVSTGGQCVLGVAVSSATTIAANDSFSLRFESGVAQGPEHHSVVIPYMGSGGDAGALTAGSNVFTLEAKVSGSVTGTIANALLTVIPLN